MVCGKRYDYIVAEDPTCVYDIFHATLAELGASYSYN
jgi:hypothetical protein